MSNCRHHITTHNGIDCLHVVIENPEKDALEHAIIQAYIPIADILSSLDALLQAVHEPAHEATRAIVCEELKRAHQSLVDDVKQALVTEARGQGSLGERRP